MPPRAGTGGAARPLAPWPLVLQSPPTGNGSAPPPQSIDTAVGDCTLFDGRDFLHWRDHYDGTPAGAKPLPASERAALTGVVHTLLLLHYVHADYPEAECSVPAQRAGAANPGETPPLPGVSTAFAAEAVPFLAVPQGSRNIASWSSRQRQPRRPCWTACRRRSPAVRKPRATGPVRRPAAAASAWCGQGSSGAGSTERIRRSRAQTKK